MVMKRSGFTRPRYTSLPPAPPRPLSRAVNPWQIDGNVRARPKVRPVVSETYRQLVRQLPCARCGHPPPSQFCHADCGKGMATKTDDRLGWAGCGPRDGYRGCHDLVGSSGHYSRERRRLLERTYAEWTRAQIMEAERWPADLPRWDDLAGA
jgi:hypothetical protein